MIHQLPELPFSKNALEPIMSVETLEYHYGKHHKGYVDKLNQLIQKTEFENSSLEDIILRATGPIFNNAAQVWNHTFFWKCLTPQQGQTPTGELVKAIEKHFGNFETFQNQFTQAANTLFGSGWAWLVRKSDGSLAIETTSNADNPLRHGNTPLLTCDVWEHAYYIDYRNERPRFTSSILKLLNWKFAEQNFFSAKQQAA